jgi:hypothetical protein
MPDILIQVNEDNAKFFRLMVKCFTLTKIWSLNAIPASSRDIYIHHETWRDNA